MASVDPTSSASRSQPAAPAAEALPSTTLAQQASVPRVNVLGVGISALNLDTATAAIARAVETRTKGYVCVTGVHGVIESQTDPDFRRILNRSFLTTPDGMPTVWMGRLQGVQAMRRVYGPDLMLRVCEWSVSSGCSHFFYGGGPSVASELASRLTAKFPGLRVAGIFEPPFRPLSAAEQEALVRQVSAVQPDIVWVGLSTPKQERFMAEQWQKLDATLFIGVGAAFDFHAGRVRQAPLWMQRSGLEWLFRLACEPRRLWKRYFRNNPLFLLHAAAQLTGLRRYPLDEVCR